MKLTYDKNIKIIQFSIILNKKIQKILTLIKIKFFLVLNYKMLLKMVYKDELKLINGKMLTHKKINI